MQNQFQLHQLMRKMKMVIEIVGIGNEILVIKSAFFNAQMMTTTSLDLMDQTMMMMMMIFLEVKYPLRMC